MMVLMMMTTMMTRLSNDDVHVDDDAIQISLDSEDNCSVLELNVTLPKS